MGTVAVDDFDKGTRYIIKYIYYFILFYKLDMSKNKDWIYIIFNRNFTILKIILV